jgi:hypothetical protein
MPHSVELLKRNVQHALSECRLMLDGNHLTQDATSSNERRRRRRRKMSNTGSDNSEQWP